MPAARKVPRPFTMHWGSGEIVEEASYASEYHEPTVQLLQYTDPENAGALTLRFCTYSPRGAFQRSPLMVGEHELEGLREALRGTPRIRELLRRLVD
jgi:hypothetical protein